MEMLRDQLQSHRHLFVTLNHLGMRFPALILGRLWHYRASLMVSNPTTLYIRPTEPMRLLKQK
ncbi:hypothetical protein ACTXT7_016128 [Hymenolepis weldensis]